MRLVALFVALGYSALACTVVERLPPAITQPGGPDYLMLRNVGYDWLSGRGDFYPPNSSSAGRAAPGWDPGESTPPAETSSPPPETTQTPEPDTWAAAIVVLFLIVAGAQRRGRRRRPRIYPG